MRTLVVFAVGATAVLGACAQTPEPPLATSAASIAQADWVLIAPPDNLATVAFIETFEFLPEHNAHFPGSTNGLSKQDRDAVEDLFEEVAAESAAEDRLDVLTEVSVLTEAPVEQWREVRTFKSAAACNATREQLIKVTEEQTQKVGAYPHMPREEFQWPLLAKSFNWSRCVPAGMGASVDGG